MYVLSVCSTTRRERPHFYHELLVRDGRARAYRYRGRGAAWAGAAIEGRRSGTWKKPAAASPALRSGASRPACRRVPSRRRPRPAARGGGRSSEAHIGVVAVLVKGDPSPACGKDTANPTQCSRRRPVSSTERRAWMCTRAPASKPAVAPGRLCLYLRRG